MRKRADRRPLCRACVAVVHGQLMPQRQILGGQCGATGKKTSNEQPDYLKNAHPWTSVAEPNGLIVPLMSLHGNTRKSFARKADGVFGRDTGLRAD